MLRENVPGHFKQRRERLFSKHPDGVFIFASNPHPIRNHDVHYPFRQDSTFFYFSGFDEPGATLVLVPNKDKKSASNHKMVLFVQRRDPKHELWDGERYGRDRAVSVFGADEAFETSDLEARLSDLLKGADEVFYRIGRSEEQDRFFLDILKKILNAKGRSGEGLSSISDWRPIVGEMRLYKTSEEIELLRTAAKISAEAHQELMKFVKPGINEYEVEAFVEYEMKRRGCERMGYGTIAAGGKNATCLHYVTNNEKLADGDLILVDAGGEFNYYTGDITRTFPVGKKFTETQRQVYEAVLKAQKSTVDLAKPGIAFDSLHENAKSVLEEELLSMGVIKKKTGDIKRFYPHGTSHWLGMDVHDCGLYKVDGESRKLESGMAFTVEPGLYFQPDDQITSDEYRGIGIRIEDNIVITDSGHENLTQFAAKEVEEIEKLKSL